MWVPTSYKDFAPTELAPVFGWRSYKDFAPTELVIENAYDRRKSGSALANGPLLSGICYL